MNKEYIDREVAIESIKNDLPNIVNYRKADAIECLKILPATDVVEIPQSGIGDLSDGYHTFNELYHHRAILFSVVCNSMPDRAWKSKLHDTGDMFDGMFIVGIETPQGQATYHYDINPYWDMFKVKELEKAPKWDGHTPKDAIERISGLKADVAEVQHGKWIPYEVEERFENIGNPYHNYLKYEPLSYRCSLCGRIEEHKEPYCNCGAKMRGGKNE